jgi:hypothetical protein
MTLRPGRRLEQDDRGGRWQHTSPEERQRARSLKRERALQVRSMDTHQAPVVSGVRKHQHDRVDTGVTLLEADSPLERLNVTGVRLGFDRDRAVLKVQSTTLAADGGIPRPEIPGRADRHFSPPGQARVDRVPELGEQCQVGRVAQDVADGVAPDRNSVADRGVEFGHSHDADVCEQPALDPTEFGCRNADLASDQPLRDPSVQTAVLELGLEIRESPTTAFVSYQDCVRAAWHARTVAGRPSPVLSHDRHSAAEDVVTRRLSGALWQRALALVRTVECGREWCETVPVGLSAPIVRAQYRTRVRVGAGRLARYGRQRSGVPDLGCPGGRVFEPADRGLVSRPASSRRHGRSLRSVPVAPGDRQR